ncbi:hypothetical protein VB780_05675 [Leptolyngbya sp. CCNP1308]|uniref:hypothetical protein n=1 Tax=Leptolyngbya sp. CCNP1308 TaxID=3110255 RepID=UPI002B21BDCC|nr:hypothetical protein [Leptolyngbya sp. CCNP1308]MEA5448049.1 hypothetical protein [Leptolyngbya sp. CCNP1308]
MSDPSSNKIVANLSNRAVSGMLRGWKWGLSTQGIEHSKRSDIWRDRTLRRAFELMGGVPAIQLLPTQSSISPQILAELADPVALPAATRAA